MTDERLKANPFFAMGHMMGGLSDIAVEKAWLDANHQTRPLDIFDLHSSAPASPSTSTVPAKWYDELLVKEERLKLEAKAMDRAYDTMRRGFIFWRRAFIALLVACMIGVAGVAFSQETGNGDTEVVNPGD